MPKNEAKIKFTAECTEFNQEIKNANATLSTLRAGMKLNEAEFKNTGDKAEYLKNKHRILSEELEVSRTKQEALNSKLETAKNIFGDNSQEAQKYALQVTRAKTEEENLKAQLAECETELKNHEQAARDNESAMEEVGRATSEAADAAEKSSGGWSVFKQVLANIATDALGLIVDKLKEAARAVVETGSSFESSMSNVAALSGASTDELARLEETAKELGRSTVFSASEVADAFGYMALAGWDTSDMLEGVDGVLNLAAASQMDLADASDIVTDYLTAFGLSASDSGKFVDQMAYAMSHSNTTTEALGEAYKNCAATAHSMGFTVEDTTAALMTMANAGVKGGEAGSGLSSIMTRLATNTKDCANELSDYGVEVYDSKGNMNSLSSILGGCAEVWETLTQEEQANLAKTIAGTTQYSKFQTVMSGLNEEAKKNGTSFYDYTYALESCNGAASDMADTMTNNLQGAITEAGSAAEGLGIALYDKVKGPLTSAVNIATDMINGITDAITPQKSELELFIDEIEQSNKAVQETLDNSKNIMDNAGSDTAKLDAYKETLLSVNDTEQKSEFQKFQLKKIVDELSGSIPELAEAFDSETGSLNLTNEQIVELMNNQKALVMQQAIIEAQEQAYKAQADAMINVAMAESALETAENNLAEAKKKNEESNDYLKGGYGDLYAEVMDYEAAQDSATKTLETANKQQEEAAEQVEIVEKALNGLEEQYGITADATEEQKEATEETTAAMEGQAEATAEAAEEIAQAYEDMRSSIEESIKGSVDMFEEFSGGTEVTAQEVIQNLDSQISGISNWSENIQRLAGEAGNGMTQEFYDYLVQMGPESANLIQTLVDALDGETGEFEAICSKWAEAMNLSNNAELIANNTEAGKAAGKAVGEGLAQSTAEIDTTSMEEAGQSAAQSTAEGITNNASQITDAADQAVSEAAKNAASEAQKAGEKIGKSFSNGTDKALQSMKNFSSGISRITVQSAKSVTQMQTAVSKSFESMKSDADKNLQAISSAAGTNMQKTALVTNTGINAVRTSVTTGTIYAAAAARNAFSGIPSSAAASMNEAVYHVSNGVTQMRNALNVTLRGPNIQVPHFSMSGAFNAKTNSVPTVNVAWYAKGAIFTRPTMFAFDGETARIGGETEDEAILPISLLENYIDRAFQRNTPERTKEYNFYLDNATVNSTEEMRAVAKDFIEEMVRLGGMMR